MNLVNSNSKIRFVVVDIITDNEVSDLYLFEAEAQAAINDLEKNDRLCGCYEKNSYRVAKVETI